MKILLLIIMVLPLLLIAQKKQDSISIYKKRVLQQTEINQLTSFYKQDGSNAAVTGGIGTEKLINFANNIEVAIPLNDDDILSIDATVSAYTSASSSNLDPFSGASSSTMNAGTPWLASSGASKKDVLLSGNIGYSHSSNNRNTIFSTHINTANEYDYSSFGAGVSLTKLYNHKNTEISLGGNIYLDNWRPQYPIEIKSFYKTFGNLEADIFNDIDILDNTGTPIDKNGSNTWKPQTPYKISDNNRNTYSASFSFSQIVNKNTQFSIFSDITYQMGWLANPMQRVYFSDKDNYYIGNAKNIDNYTNPSNVDVFQLADGIERLPDSRLKIPIGIRLNHYINESLVIRTYYRYYFDDWGIKSNTFNIELPIKLGKYTFYPSYRFYNQSEADYFAPFEQHLSTDYYYTSDYDLSAFRSNQFGLGFKYTDILLSRHLWKFGLKDITLNYNYYKRSTGLEAHIISIGTKFIFDK